MLYNFLDSKIRGFLNWMHIGSDQKLVYLHLLFSRHRMLSVGLRWIFSWKKSRSSKSNETPRRKSHKTRRNFLLRRSFANTATYFLSSLLGVCFTWSSARMFANNDKIGFGVFSFYFGNKFKIISIFFEMGLLDSQIFARIPTLAPRFAKNITNSKSLREVLLEGKTVDVC